MMECVVNRMAIEQLLNQKGRRYKGTRGRHLAAAKIQVFMRHEICKIFTTIISNRLHIVCIVRERLTLSIVASSGLQVRVMCDCIIL